MMEMETEIGDRAILHAFHVFRAALKFLSAARYVARTMFPYDHETFTKTVDRWKKDDNFRVYAADRYKEARSRIRPMIAGLPDMTKDLLAAQSSGGSRHSESKEHERLAIRSGREQLHLSDPLPGR